MWWQVEGEEEERDGTQAPITRENRSGETGWSFDALYKSLQLQTNNHFYVDWLLVIDLLGKNELTLFYLRRKDLGWGGAMELSLYPPAEILKLYQLCDTGRNPTGGASVNRA